MKPSVVCQKLTGIEVSNKQTAKQAYKINSWGLDTVIITGGAEGSFNC
jgi:hypothetical protein